ncbi:MAG TPA: caspase family protein, partial [Pyrinomonadaceae bacterium]
MEQAPAVARLPAESNRWAVVVGVDEFSDKKIRSLRGAANDAGMLKEVLSTQAGFPEDHIHLLASDQPGDHQPTRANILYWLSALAGRVKEDGLLLMAFSSHGITRQGEGYLFASDSRTSDDPEFLEESALSVTRLRERILKTGAGQVVLLLDACRSTPGEVRAGETGSEPLSAAFVKGFNFDTRNRGVRAFSIFHATDVGKYAYEFKEERQGYFTWAVVKGLKGEAANERGEVTLQGLVDYVEEVVPRKVLADLGKEQIPIHEIKGYKTSKLVLSLGKAAGPGVEATSEYSEWKAVENTEDVNTLRRFVEKYP